METLLQDGAEGEARNSFRTAAVLGRIAPSPACAINTVQPTDTILGVFPSSRVQLHVCVITMPPVSQYPSCEQSAAVQRNLSLNAASKHACCWKLFALPAVTGRYALCLQEQASSTAVYMFYVCIYIAW